jgi:hypothetical protein
VEALDAGTKKWSGLPPRGMAYWRRLNDVIQNEPVEPRAALVGEAMAKANSAERRFADGQFRPGSHWDFALRLDADQPDAFWNLLDERASWFYEAVGAGTAITTNGDFCGDSTGGPER